MGSDTNSSSSDQFGSLTVKNSTFNDNNATDDGGAIYTDDTTTALHFNRITGNTATYGSAVYNFGSKVDALLNWWGCNTAASVAKQISNNYGGIATYNPWIILTITANPTTVYITGTSTITADLLHDSNGVYEDPANGLVPYTGSAGFVTSMGTIKNVNFSNGKATSTLTDLNKVGGVTVSATVDGKEVSTLVKVKGFHIVVTIITPANGTTNVPTNQVIKITFSEPNGLPLKEGSEFSSISVKNSNGNIPQIFTLFSGNTLTITCNGTYALGDE